MKANQFTIIYGFFLIFVLQSCSLIDDQRALPPTTKFPVLELGVFCPTKIKEARKHYNQALSYHRNGNKENAKMAYQAAIDLDSNYCDAMDNLGLILRSEGKLDEAELWYSKSININPQNTVALTNRSLVYRIKGEVEKAKFDYLTIAKIDVNNPESYFGLGAIFYDQKKYKEAIDQFQKASAAYRLLKSSYESQANYYLGMSHFRLAQWIEAREALEAAYPHFQTDANLNFFLGMSYLTGKRHNVEKARLYLKRAKELEVNLPEEALSIINVESELTN